MIQVKFQLFSAIHDPSSENHCSVDFGELGIELDSLRESIAARKKDFGTNSILKASDAERVRIIVGSILGGMEFDLILVGRTLAD